MSQNKMTRSGRPNLSKSKICLTQHLGFTKNDTGAEERGSKISFKLGNKLIEQSIADKTSSYSRTQPPELENGQYLKKNKKQEEQESDKLLKTQNKGRLGELSGGLLPDYLSFKLPQNLEHLWKLVSRIDGHLLRLPKKQMGQSFANIKKLLKKVQGIEVEEIHLQQINYILPAYYNYYKDPFNNLVLGLPKGQNRYIRQHNFRKMMHSLHMEMLKSPHHSRVLPTKKLMTKPTQCFYPILKTQSPDSPESLKTKIKSQFILMVLSSVTEKQASQNILPQLSEVPSAASITKQKEWMREIYEQKKVSSIYKATLVELLEGKMGSEVSAIMKGLERILEAEEGNQFHVVKIQGRTIVRYAKGIV